MTRALTAPLRSVQDREGDLDQIRFDGQLCLCTHILVLLLDCICIYLLSKFSKMVGLPLMSKLGVVFNLNNKNNNKIVYERR